MVEAFVVCFGIFVSLCVYVGLYLTNGNSLQMTEKKRNKWMEQEIYRKNKVRKMF
mgnify:CR=1 FL=1